MLHLQDRTQLVVTGFTCDRCAIEVPATELAHQEALHIDFVGGFASVFGDGARVRCDLCQDCLHCLIKDFCRISPSQPSRIVQPAL